MNDENEVLEKFKGRPLFENLHKMNQTSLLSHKSLEIDMKGFFNLLVILIFTTNFRLVLENFKKYGLIIKIPTSCDIIKNLPILLCFICLNIGIFFSWFIERYVTSWLYQCVNNKSNEDFSDDIYPNDNDEKDDYEFLSNIYDEHTDNNENFKNLCESENENRKKKNKDEELINTKNENSELKKRQFLKKKNSLKKKKVKKKKIHGWKGFHLSIFLLICINSIFVLLLPFLTISYYDTEPILSTVLLSISIVWFFKFYSFHQVCYDIRKLYIENVNLDNVENLHYELKFVKNYPYCLNFKNYYTYILMPTMCFQFCYPRTKKIRWLHVAKHILEVFLLIIMIKIISDQYMFITVKNTFTMKEFSSAQFSVKLTHIIERMLKVSIPTLYIWLIGFLIVFHHWCNILAEITRFGDRLFYKDWWNASSFAEYWRKWNLPIHYFVSRHINKPLINYGINRKCSMVVVFLLSALLHEYLISIPLKLGFSGYIFFAFICQIPLIHLTNNEFFKKHKTIGNSIFWMVFCFTGQPLILFIYYYMWIEKQGILKNH
ncbi:diacylglycerol O-acyltransferase, putative [Plasmodium gallinaceum]|uniref:O-acyltransferase n=1 Tax=Plasmodium gallinaceum TaxID=5849 RepID=A0A1J1GPK2_PLAGA|nr:diacylglycerol O-acyltransferase, putative [Plasmodium gallinaceum]CRG94236.1 diacylglycerol O-acyltransferase, putative [Plasmodium gallinaceum]